MQDRAKRQKNGNTENSLTARKRVQSNHIRDTAARFSVKDSQRYLDSSDDVHARVISLHRACLLALEVDTTMLAGKEVYA